MILIFLFWILLNFSPYIFKCSILTPALLINPKFNPSKLIIFMLELQYVNIYQIYSENAIK